ncbi:elongator complex protein 3 [uncultured Veillonella sp.]|uniref:elongator complex protein 3 n=1 Tax=uncultured Veillonella sp. TaxID=159268 RepID=UPI0026708BC6|nr:radical SAM protein [uncultured Veillonella sp.]
MKPFGMIPFFIPHVGCPYVCTFCNQSRITGQSGISHLTPDYIQQTIKDYVGTKRCEKFWEVAFYGGSFTAIPKDLQHKLLMPAYEILQRGIIDGIRCSTRPDAVGDEAITLLQSYGVKTVELGVQSMNDGILFNAKRGHTAQKVVEAVTRLKQHDMIVGVQLLPGLKGETWQTIIETAITVAALQPDFIRIYPVLVIENTELADQYRDGEYEPLSTELAIEYCAFLKNWFEQHGIEVIRTGLQSTEELDSGNSLVAGPYEPAMGELVVNEQYKQRIERCIDEHVSQYKYSLSNDCFNLTEYATYENLEFSRVNADNTGCKDKTNNDKTNYIGNNSIAIKHNIIISYPRSLTSKVRGLKNRNVLYFAELYPQYSISWCEESRRNTVRCCIDGLQYVL